MSAEARRETRDANARRYNDADARYSRRSSTTERRRGVDEWVGRARGVEVGSVGRASARGGVVAVVRRRRVVGVVGNVGELGVVVVVDGGARGEGGGGGRDGGVASVVGGLRRAGDGSRGRTRQAARVQAQRQARALLNDVFAREQADDARAGRHDVHVTQTHRSELTVGAADARVGVHEERVALHETSQVDGHRANVFFRHAMGHLARARHFERNLLQLLEQIVAFARVGEQIVSAHASTAARVDEGNSVQEHLEQQIPRDGAVQLEIFARVRGRVFGHWIRPVRGLSEDL